MTFRTLVALLTSFILAFAGASTANATEAAATPIVTKHFDGYFVEVVDDDVDQSHYLMLVSAEDSVFKIAQGSIPTGTDHTAKQTLLACMALKASLRDDKVTDHAFYYKDGRGVVRHLNLRRVPVRDGFGRPILFKEQHVKRYDCSTSLKYYAEG